MITAEPGPAGKWEAGRQACPMKGTGCVWRCLSYGKAWWHLSLRDWGTGLVMALMAPSWNPRWEKLQPLPLPSAV